VHVLGTAPWQRAPLLLLRRPVIFLGIAIATGVLAIAASAGVLFASTLGTASLRAQAAESCPEDSMPALSAAMFLDPGAHVSLTQVNDAGVTALRRAGIPGAGYAVDLTGGAIGPAPVTLFSRVGALDHVETLTPDAGQAGVWFPSDFATASHIQPGQTVTLNGGADLRVAGIYRALAPDPFRISHLPRYWCTWSQLILQKITGNYGTPPFLIADPQTVAAAGTNVVGAFERDVQTTWYAPVPVATMTLDEVRAVAQRIPAAYRLLGSLVPKGLPLGIGADDPSRSGGVPGSTPLEQEIDRAQRVQDGLSGSVLPISVAGAIVALLLVAEAGGSWAARRAREVRLLTARGVGPGAIAAKAFLETLPPVIVGLGAGYGLSYLLMRILGPASPFGAGAAARAAWIAAVAVLAGLALIAVVGGLSAREARAAAEPRRHRHVLRRLPYELLLVGGAVWVWFTIRSGQGIDYAQHIVNVHPLLLIFPLLGLTGLVLLLGRGAFLLVPRLGWLARRLPAAGYLALRRVGGSRAIAVGLLLGTALPCGLLAYAGTVSVGVHDELVRKYQTNLGAPHVLELIGVREATPDLAGHGTAVVVYPNGATLPGGAPVTVMGIDPATFGRFSYADGAQRSLARRLTGAGAAILVQAPEDLAPAQVHIGSTTIPIRVVGRADVFPGLRGNFQPLLVLDRDVLAHVDPDVDRINEAWTTAGQVEPASRAIARDGYTISEFDPKVRVTNSGLLPITWIFGYLRALAVLIGAVAIAGLVFALSARTRRRTVSYVMSRRMGLRQRTHLRSLLVELLAVVGLGWVVGTGTGLAGYAVLTGSLDLQPQLPPGAQFVLPVLSLAATAAAVAVVIGLAAAGTHVAAERANPADILRLE
jgi:putative ABC transport system permease protein